MEKWRPHDWEKTKENAMGYGTRYAVAIENHDYREVFEAGADAMLETVIELDTYCANCKGIKQLEEKH